MTEPRLIKPLAKHAYSIALEAKGQGRPIKVSPSLLSADPKELDREILKLCRAGADLIHLDIMDGQFVPNITVGEDLVKRVKDISTVPLDVHLMIQNVEQHAEKFIKAGADLVTFHIESEGFDSQLPHYLKSLRNIRVGASIVPETPAAKLQDLLKEIDFVLVMTVNPGLGGQKFLFSQIPKIKDIKNMIGANTQSNKHIDIAVDGGINPSTAKICIEAGANILVSGSYIFGEPFLPYKDKIDLLKGI